MCAFMTSGAFLAPPNNTVYLKYGEFMPEALKFNGVKRSWHLSLWVYVMFVCEIKGSEGYG